MPMKFQCPKCAQSFEAEDEMQGLEIDCPACNAKMTVPTKKVPPPMKKTPPPLTNPNFESNDGNGQKGLSADIANKITGIAGLENIEGFSFKELFSSVFQKHTVEEIEDHFAVGTEKTTPLLKDLDTSLPKPWAFFRAMGVSLICYFIFRHMWNEYQNTKIIPGLMLVGSFAIPVSTLIFFFETNVLKNVSAYQVLKLFMVGGVLSLLFTLYLGDKIKINISWLGGASSAGPVEEPAKLLALFLIIYSSRYKYTLNGLLFGAAVGAGFAAFESAGYAFGSYSEGNILGVQYYGNQSTGNIVGVDQMVNNIEQRGFLAPFCHVVWTAIVGAALWKAKGDRDFSLDILWDFNFLRILLISIALHMLWNCKWGLYKIPVFGDLKYLILGIVAWVIVFAFIQSGLNQVKQKKSELI